MEREQKDFVERKGKLKSWRECEEMRKMKKKKKKKKRLLTVEEK